MENIDFYKKLMRIQSDLKAPKGQKNAFGGYKYRSCEDILEAVKPLLRREEMILIISDEIVSVEGRVYIKATATVSDGVTFMKAEALAREADTKKPRTQTRMHTRSRRRRRKRSRILGVRPSRSRSRQKAISHSTSKSRKRKARSFADFVSS